MYTHYIKLDSNKSIVECRPLWTLDSTEGWIEYKESTVRQEQGACPELFPLFENEIPTHKWYGNRPVVLNNNDKLKYQTVIDKDNRMTEIQKELKSLDYKTNKQIESEKLVALGKIEATYYTDEEIGEIYYQRYLLREEYNELEGSAE